MIKTIIFDFGDVFMDLDKTATPIALQKLGLTWNANWKQKDLELETGKITPEVFLNQLRTALPNTTTSDILKAWNAVMVTFPKHRLDFLKNISQKYQLFLLSNTDAIHFKGFESHWGKDFSDDFYNCFEACYYSYALKVKKPNTQGFKHIIQKHSLIPKQTLFVDDNANNTAAAKKLGLHIWTIQKGIQDVTELFDQNLPFN